MKAPLFIMKSNGGVTSADLAARQAIHTVLSGPVAGVMGATGFQTMLGYPSFISVDVGGTSADICLVQGRPTGRHRRTQYWRLCRCNSRCWTSRP